MNKLWLDDIRRSPDESWDWARTISAAQELFEQKSYDVCSLDHDMGLHDYDPDEQDADLRVAPDRWRYEDGTELAYWMAKTNNVPPRIIVHSWNPPGAAKMADILRRHHSKPVVIVQPYSRP